MTVKKFVYKFVLLRILFLFFRYILTAINIVVGCFLISVLIDKCLPLPIIVFHLYWFFIIAILVVLLFNLLLRIVETVNRPCNYLQEELLKLSKLECNDDIINAYLLEEKLCKQDVLNFSRELAVEFVNKILRLLSEINLYKIVGFDKLLKVLPLNFLLLAIIYVLYFVPPYVIKPSIYKILFTRRPEILGIFILPKNCKLPYKSSCEIKVIVEKEYSMYKPELFIKYEGEHKFYKLNFETSEDFAKRKIYKYKIISVEKPIFYKIKFRGISSKIYMIEPILYPEISELIINVFPPQYTQIKPYTIHSFTETKYITGSKIIFKARSNKELSSVKMYINDYETHLKVQPDLKTFNGELVVTRDMLLYFVLQDIDGFSNQTIKYKIVILEDKPPEIEILSPATDIVATINSQIPIVYTVKDDFSVSKVEFRYAVQQKQKIKTELIKKFNFVTTESVEEYIFDLSTLKLTPGDVIIYSFLVYDNDIVSGPKYNMSKEYKIEIFKYEDQHQNIQKELQQFIDKTTDLLGKEIELYEYLKNLTPEQTNEINKLLTEHKKLNKQFEDIENLLNSILDKMLTDPYTTMDTYSEFKNLAENINTMRNGLLQQFINKLADKDLSSAKLLQERVIENLERASALSKDIIKKQNMENINNSMNNITSTAKDLMSTLQNVKDKITEEEFTKISNLLKEIEEKLNEIQNLIKSMHDQLPQEFVNRRDVQSLDFVSPMNILQNIARFISQGDITSAIQQMERLLKQLDTLSKILSNASNEILNYSMSELKTKLDKLLEELDELITSEQQIFNETKEIDNYRISEMLKQQQKLITLLYEKVKNVISKINNILTLHELENFELKEIYRLNSISVIDNLQKILNEIENKRLIQTPELVSRSVNIWYQNVQIVPQQFVELSSSTIEVYKMIKELDELINKEINIDYPQKVKQKNKTLFDKQTETVNKTKKLKETMREIGRKSFLISTEDVEIISTAEDKMKLSCDALSSYNFPEALQNQNSAINLLMQLKNNLSGKQGQLQQMLQQTGVPVGSTVQTKQLPGGRTGVLTGRVVLPSAKDYLPPKELREDIIRALSEKYPTELKKYIEEYYKELLK